MSDPPPSSPSPHATQIDRLSQRLDELQSQQSGMRKTLLIFSLVLVVIILLFGWGLYSSVSSNLAPDKLEKELMDRVDAHTPRLQRTATEAISLAMPTYQTLAKEKLTEITPQLREDATKQLEAMPEKLRVKLYDRLETLRTDLEAEVTAEIKSQFGDISEEQVETIATQFTAEIEKSGKNIKADLERIYDEQANRLEQVLSKFEIADNAQMSEQEIQMKLIESAALLVAHLVQNPDELPVMPDALKFDGKSSDKKEGADHE